MGVFVLVDKLRECLRFFEGSQVLALNVFDEGQLDRFQIVDVPLDARELAQVRLKRCLIATLSRNNLVVILSASND